MDKNTGVIRGTLYWAKVLGTPRMNTFTGEREWSVDITPDADGMALVKKFGITDRLRDPKEGDERTDRFLTFKQREFRTDKDGVRHPNRPIKIVDIQNRAWPSGALIGNGSVADVKFDVVDYGKGKPKGCYIQAIRVLKHVPFVSDDFAPISEDDEFFGAREISPAAVALAYSADTGNGADLDDDLPF